MGANTSFENTERLISVLDEASHDRASMADILGISLTGVRNTVSFLKEHGIVGEYKSKGVGKIYLKSGPVFAIADIFSQKIVTYIFGYGLNITDSFTHKMSDSLFIDDSYREYVRYLGEKYPKLSCICFLSDGVPYNGRFKGSVIHGLSNINLGDFVREYFDVTTVMTDTRERYASVENTGFTASVTDEDGTLSVKIFLDGTVVSNTSFDFKNIPIGTRSAANCVKYARTSSEYVSATADLFYGIFSLVNVKRICFSTDRYSDTSILIERIVSELTVRYGCPPLSIPEIVPSSKPIPSESIAIRRNVRRRMIKGLF